MKKNQKKIKRSSLQSLNCKKKIRQRLSRSLRLKGNINSKKLCLSDNLAKTFSECSQNLINEITSFLDVEDIIALSRTNRHFYKNINGLKGTQQKIEIEKTKLNDKVYSILNSVACRQVEEMFSSNAINRAMSNDINDTDKCLVIDERNGILGNVDTYAAVIIAHRMFFDIWGNIWRINPDLYADGKLSIDLLENFLNTNEIKQKNENLLQKRYVRCTGNVFIDCLRMYVNDITADFDKRAKIKVMSEFIQFWLWQLMNLSRKKEQADNRGDHALACCLLLNKWEVVEMGLSFFGPVCDFSIDFKEFVEKLSTKRLESLFLDNEYNFVIHFKYEILDDLDLVLRCIAKKQTLIKEKKSLDSKIKTLLSNLSTPNNLCADSSFISKLKIVWYKQKTKLKNGIKFFIGNKKNYRSLPLGTLKSKLAPESQHYKHDNRNKLQVPKQDSNLFKNPFIK